MGRADAELTALRTVGACAILIAPMVRMKLLSLLLLSIALAFAPLYPLPAHAVPMHAGKGRATAVPHAGHAPAADAVSTAAGAHECTLQQPQQTCDGQCCAQCAHALSAMPNAIFVALPPTRAVFGQSPPRYSRDFFKPQDHKPPIAFT